MAKNESKLRKALSKLFSSSVVVRNIGGKKLKVADTANLQQARGLGRRPDGYSRGRYTGGFGSGFGGGMAAGSSGAYGTQFGFTANRWILFNDYERMDQDPIISAALDLYADESVVTDEHSDLLRIKCDDSDVKDILHNLFYDILNINVNLRWWTRNTVKYGDHFLKLDVVPEYGVINAAPISAYEMSRIEGEDPENPYKIKFALGDEGSFSGAGLHSAGRQKDDSQFEYWEIAHFRFVTDGNYLPYGKSVIEGARREWKRLTLMEDAMMIHRIMRAPEKRVFYIDVGNLEPEGVEPHINKIINKFKKAPVIDQQTGEYNLQFNLENMLDDYFLPVRGRDSGTNIETLPELRQTFIEDIEYLRTKMMTALKVPNAFLGFERDLQGKATLSQESMVFSHMIRNIQKVMVNEMKKIGIIHLFAQGIKDKRLFDWDIELSNPSTILEKEYLDIVSSKLNIVRTLNDNNMFSTEWVYKNLFHMSDDEIKEQRRLRVMDWKRKFRAEQIEREGNDPIKTGQSFGTPSDLALSGSQFTKPLEQSLTDLMRDAEEFSDMEQAEREKRKAAIYGISADDKDDGRPKQSDLSQNFQGGSPLALDSINPSLKSKLIKETFDLGDDHHNEEDLDHTFLNDESLDQFERKVNEVLKNTEHL